MIAQIGRALIGERIDMTKPQIEAVVTVIKSNQDVVRKLEIQSVPRVGSFSAANKTQSTVRV